MANGAAPLKGPERVLPANLPNYRQPRNRRLQAIYALAIGGLLFFSLIYGAAFALFAPFLLAPLALPLVLFALAVIWALPDSPGAPTGALEILFDSVIIVIVAWPNYVAIVLPGLPWITFLRLTSFPMAAVFLLSVATSSDVREYFLSVFSKSRIMIALLAAFVVIQTLTIPLSHAPFASLQLYMILQIQWTIMFLVAVWVFRKPGRVEVWGGFLWSLGIFVCLVGLLEYKMHQVPWAGRLPGFLKIDPLYLANTMRAFTENLRIKSTFSSPLGLSEYLALAFPFVMQFAAGGRQIWIRCAAAATIPLFLFIIILTDSRLGLVGCFVTLVLYPLIPALRHWKEQRRSIIAPAIVVAYPVLFCGALAAAMFIGKLRHLLLGGGAQQSSTDSRVVQYNLGFLRVMHNPIGYGPGQSGAILDYHGPGGFQTIDTYYLVILLEYGVVGFIVYYSLIGFAIANAGRAALFVGSKDRDAPFLLPVALSLLNFFIIKSVFAEVDNHPLIFAMMGMVVAVCARLKLSPAVHSGSVPHAEGGAA
jgi:hypothetical protein